MFEDFEVWIDTCSFAWVGGISCVLTCLNYLWIAKTWNAWEGRLQDYTDTVGIWCRQLAICRPHCRAMCCNKKPWLSHALYHIYTSIIYIRMYLYYACISIRLTSCTIDEWPRGMLNQLMHCLMNLDMLWCVWNDGVYLMCHLIMHPYSKYMFSNDGASIFPLSLPYLSNALCYALQHPEEVWPCVLVSKPPHN